MNKENHYLYLFEYNDLCSEDPTEIHKYSIYEENLFLAIKKFHKNNNNSMIINIYKQIYNISEGLSGREIYE